MASEPRLEGNYYYSRDRVNGKLIRIRLAKDKSESNRLLRIYETNKARGRFGVAPEVGSVSWEDVMKRFDTFITTKKELQTIKRDRICLKFFNAWANIKCLPEFNQQLMENYQSYRKNDCGMSEATLNRELGTFKSLAKKIVEWYGVQNPMVNVKMISIRQPDNVRFLSPEERVALKAYLENDELKVWKTAYIIGLNAGLREGESCHLKWKNVDFVKWGLTITAKPESTPPWKPKTPRITPIPMNNILYNELKHLHNERKPSPDDWVLLINGHPVNEFVMSSMFRKIMRGAGVHDASYKTLRNTFATTMQEKGITPRALMRYMGHTSIKTVMHYWGVTDEKQDKIVRGFNYDEDEDAGPTLAIAK